jgi:hypothetical protein
MVSMKRFGAGALGSGFVAFGFALSVGIVSIGMNAVGWIAVGLNAAGFVSVGLINSVGVFSFGGVNACGGWGSGGTNAEGGRWFGIVAAALLALGFLVARVRTWPRGEVELLVPLEVAARGGVLQARARIEAVDDEVTLRDGATVVRARATTELATRCTSMGRGARVLATFTSAPKEVATAGYRDEAAVIVPELVSVVPDPRPGFAAALFQGSTGVNLVFSWLGLAAAIVAFFVWR